MFDWLREKFTTKLQRDSQSGTDQQKLALATRSNITRYEYEESKSLASLAQGTIAACLRARASERSVLRFIIKEYGKEDSKLAKRLTALFECPNPVQSRTDFLELASQHYDQNGNAAILLIPDDSGFPVEMWLMPSYYFRAVFETVDNPVPYGYRWQDSRVTIPTDQLILLRNNSFKTGPYKGRGVTVDDQNTAKLYESISQAQSAFFERGGLFHAVVESPQGVFWTPEQIADFQNNWAAKFNPKSGVSDIPILQDGATLKTVGPTEIDFIKSKDEIRDAIRESFQMPKVILGDTDNVNHNNGQTALALFERIIILRFGEKMASAFEHRFRQNFHPSITVEVDPKVKDSFTQLQENNGVVRSQPKETVPEYA